MPLFQYTANDESGRRVEGILQGTDWKEVDSILQRRGLKLTGVAEVQNPAPAQDGQISAPIPTAVAASAPAKVVPAVANTQVSSPAQNRIVGVGRPARVKTKWASDRDTMFLFSQIESYLKAGVNPAQAFTNLAGSWQAKFKMALTDMAQAATEGRSVGTEMMRFPYLFAPHVVGAYRAGEVGGFLPAVCGAISKQAEDSQKLKFWFRLLNLFFWLSIACFPVVVWGVNGLLGAWDKMEKTGGAGNGGAMVGSAMGESFLQVLPWTIVLSLLILVGAYAWQSMPVRPLRHRLTLMVPTTGKRARLESMALFSWVLSNLFESGVAPKTAVEIAASSMPNLHLSGQLSTASNRMGAETPLSKVVGEMASLTPEMRAMIQTGEIVGDLPGQLDHVYRAQRDEFQTVDRHGRFRIGCWILLVFIAATILFYAMFWRSFYDGIFKRTVDAEVFLAPPNIS
jgi:type II secretory pathway component PulF